ncbi:MAG: hypothetical protein ACI31G_04815 [Bacilli bacterium]
MKSKFVNMVKSISKRVVEDKINLVLWILYVLFCIGSGIYFSFKGSLTSALLPFAYIFLPIFILIFEYLFKIYIPTFINAVFTIFLAGALLGTVYDFYVIIPTFDLILHCVSGVLFTSFGYGIMHRLIKDKEHTFVPCLVFGIFFSLAIAGIWELMEFSMSYLFKLDMNEDSVIHTFYSYLLQGSHDHPFAVQDIVKTEIYLASGEMITIQGYLDIGLYDTISDMAICLLGTILSSITFVVIEKTRPSINDLLLVKSSN